VTKLSELGAFKFSSNRKLTASSLLVAWNQDAGRVGRKVANYLIDRLKGQEYGEIDPEGFFSLNGVLVEDDVAQFPESKFFLCQQKDLMILRSDIPGHDWYEFLNLVLDVAEEFCKVKTIYTIGGMITSGTHTAPRTLSSVTNSTNMKSLLGHHNVSNDMDYETQEHQRPTFSSFLLWVAKKRNIAGASLWVPVPFYLLSVEDPWACKKLLEFFDTCLKLNIDLADMAQDEAKQSDKIMQVRKEIPELDEYINKLENSVALTANESERLVKEIEEWLRRRK
jgi:proteasome assembly chaperone (PAC2) family protein